MLRSDVERKALYGIAAIQRLPPDAYSAEVSGMVYRAASGSPAQTLAQARAAIG